MTYGVFDLRDDCGEVHSVPLDEDKNPMNPHTLSKDCPCNPTVEKYVYYYIGHNMIH